MPVRRLMLACALLFPTGLAAQQTPPEADRRLAREILAELVAINTTQDSGATRAARALARRLTAVGFPARDVQLAGPEPRKQNLVVRLRGKGSAKPILFLAHLDVVEARREDWTMDPFRLTERDGWLYGRGTIDIKDEAADLVTNLIRLEARAVRARARHHRRPDRRRGGRRRQRRAMAAGESPRVDRRRLRDQPRRRRGTDAARPAAPQPGADEREDLRHLPARGHRAGRAQLAAGAQQYDLQPGARAGPPLPVRLPGAADRDDPRLLRPPWRPDRRRDRARPAGHRRRTGR